MQTIRKVTLEDAEAIQEIYNYYILNSIVTFDEEVKTLDEIKYKITDTIEKYPWF
ncbi:MAG: GNAT family N-acetyltransferase, partial [Flavobacteriales bacterium]|nr:GNAT family N-acetyltransferase [Flavobacteriales bacterium]